MARDRIGFHTPRKKNQIHHHVKRYSMASVIVVENELKDSVREYGQIVDSVLQNTETSGRLGQFLDENSDDIKDKSGLAQTVLQVSTADVLGRLSDKEFEPTFYLLFYLVSELNQTPFVQLLAKGLPLLQLLEECTPEQQPSLRDRRLLKPTTVLSVLNTMFNLLPADSGARVHLVEMILGIVTKTHIEFALVQKALGDNLVPWLEAAGALELDIKRLFWLYVGLDSHYSLETLHVIKTFTSRFSVSLPELHQLVLFALSSAVVDVSFVVNNNVAKALHENSSDELASLFLKYTRGELIENVPGSVPSTVAPSVAAKSRILALTRFFVESENANKTAFKYADIPPALLQSAPDFEKLLIDAIKAGVIEGKLNQVDELFHLVRVNRFILAGDNQKLAHDRDIVQKALFDWKLSLENINEIVRDAKDNIVNNNASS